MPMHRAYADWAYSMEFFNRRLYRAMGFETREELLPDWERDPLSWDANDLLSRYGNGTFCAGPWPSAVSRRCNFRRHV